jgi:multiple sugar transport system ATP-binding protein
MVRIFIDRVSKAFGKTAVLRDVALEVKDKEFFTILGPSGSGKTTILRIIAGLEKPDKGNVYFDDEDVTSLPTKDRNISMIFQSLALYQHLTVFENIAFPLKIRKVPESEVRKAVKDIASMLRIENLLNRNITSLSGGERQRVAIARALVYRPRVFLMDEPLTGLEPSFRLELREEIKNMQRATGITTVYVTHDQLEAFSLADRVALLNEGVVQDVGEPWRIYENPANLWTAKFVGDTPPNLFDGTVDSVDGTVHVFLQELGLHFTIEDRVNMPVNRRVRVAIRPEAFRVVEKHTKVNGVVVSREVLGDRIVYTVDVGGRKISVKTSVDQVIPVGGRVNIDVDKTRVMIFDSEGRAV